MSAAKRCQAILACLALALLLPASAWAARPLTLGFFDGVYTSPDASTWLARSAAAGAGMVRIDIGWDAPQTATRPAGFDARNPADPDYDFTAADAAIRLATEQGLRVLASFTGAPPWAEGPGRPADAPAGSWRPQPQALEDYGAALAERYSGHFPDPANPGQMLPRVAAFQVWNEPNLSEYLTPQWSGDRPESPVIYRAMLNAFYRGVKSEDPSALVVTAGTAPFGDPQPGGLRIMPALFWQTVLCLQTTSDGGLSGTHCPDPAHFDVLAHHPYSWGSPTTHALWPNDVAIPDIGKLTRLLRAAERTGGALPHIHHPLWVTEIGFTSSPPNPGGLPLVEQARWLEQTFAELWRQGVGVVLWYEIVDSPPDPSYADSSQSGVYLLDGQPKPSLTAFRFPLVTWDTGGSAMQVWGRAPTAGRLEIQERTAAGWTTVHSMNVAADATFLATISRFSGGIRGIVAGQSSLVWPAG
ncbi:MAG: hypothetical protein ACLP50_26820 [Solirubrobacteraceae bacterium]